MEYAQSRNKNAAIGALKYLKTDDISRWNRVLSNDRGSTESRERKEQLAIQEYQGKSIGPGWNFSP